MAKQQQQQKLDKRVFRSKLDVLEFKYKRLERHVEFLRSVEASKKHVSAAHESFYRAYERFANLAARLAERGML